MSLHTFSYEVNASANLDARAREMQARIEAYIKKINRDRLYAQNQRLSYESYMNFMLDIVDLK